MCDRRLDLGRPGGKLWGDRRSWPNNEASELEADLKESAEAYEPRPRHFERPAWHAPDVPTAQLQYPLASRADCVCGERGAWVFDTLEGHWELKDIPEFASPRVCASARR